MPIRHFPLSQSPDSETFPARSIPWLSVCIALSAVSMCGVVFAFVSVQPGQGLPDAGWLGSARGTSLAEAFGAAPASADAMRGPAKLISGVGGQTFSRGARQASLGEAELAQIAPNIAPVAWDRLSAGDCISVTVKSGQTFAFRIVGARPTEKPDHADDLPKIELTVSGCADMGEPVARAVIQPTNPPETKATNPARTL